MRSFISWRTVLPALILGVSSIVTGELSLAQAQVTRQTLDRVDVHSVSDVLEMAFDDPDRIRDFVNLGLVGTRFTSCELTATDGIFCLDGKVIRHWPNPADSQTFVDELSCNDPALKLDSRKPDTCTSMAIDLAGAIWIAGKKANTHSLIKIVAKAAGAACPDGSSVLSGSRYCARELYTGRPLLVDIDAVDGDVGAVFKPCQSCPAQSGILGLEERKTVVFFPDPKPAASTAPIVIASGKSGWNLVGSEQLMSSTVLQVPNGDAIDNFVLATTDGGRILAKQADAPASAFAVFNIPLERSPSSTQCSAGVQQYGIRASSKTGRVYVTDRNHCAVSALVPAGSPFTALVNDGDGADLTLSTADVSGSYPPAGPMLAPGISLDLEDCNPRCDLLENEEGIGASLVAIRLASGSNSGATLFQVKGIPDCRYAGEQGFPAALQTVCDNTPGVIVDPDGFGHPAAQALNVTPLLPKEVRSLFDDSGVPPNGLPPLLMSRQFRAQERNDFVFEAFFAVTEAGVHFRDTFTLELDVPVLEGVPESLGCVPDAGNLIAWDVMSTVSERYRTTDIDGDGDAEHVDMPTNVGCINPTKTQGTRLSLLPYNLEVTPDTYGPTAQSADKSVTVGNDAVFARLIQSLYGDLEFVRREMACIQVDSSPAGGPAPLAASVCSALAAKWLNGKVKLDKCIEAAFQPKQSSGDENCQSFASQLTNYRASLPATTALSDVANRLGELKTRVDVIRHVYDTRFLPSITTAGFCREGDFDGNPLTCPDPWQ